MAAGATGRPARQGGATRPRGRSSRGSLTKPGAPASSSPNRRWRRRSQAPEVGDRLSLGSPSPRDAAIGQLAAPAAVQPNPRRAGALNPLPTGSPPGRGRAAAGPACNAARQGVPNHALDDSQLRASGGLRRPRRAARMPDLRRLLHPGLSVHGDRGLCDRRHGAGVGQQPSGPGRRSGDPPESRPATRAQATHPAARGRGHGREPAQPG